MVISPRPFGQVLGDAMNSLARVWKTLFVPALAVSVPVSVISVLVFRISGAGEFVELLLNSPERLQGLPSEVVSELARPFYISVAAAAILQLLAGVFLALASHRAVASEMAGSALSGREATGKALHRYPVGLGSTFLIVVALAVLLGLGTWLWLLPLRSVGTPNMASVFVALVLLVVLVGPGMWAAVAMSMTTSVVAVERTGILESIRRSMRLVRGRWWPTMGFLLLVGLLGGIAVQLIQLIALPLAAVGGGDAALIVASALGVLTQGLLIAAIAAMYTHWYIDLRARREKLVTVDLG
jgi:hypothetical protein